MALTKCTECGHDVSTRAKACPGCGAPAQKPSDVRLGLFLVAVIGIPALIGLSRPDRSTSDQPPAPFSPVPTATTLTSSPTPPTRTLIRSAPAGHVYAYENAAGEMVEEMENRQGQLINRRFYRPALPACTYLDGVGLGTGRYWRDDGEQFFHCLSPMTELGTAAEPHGLGLKNNLAYYVDGDAKCPHDLLLKLNVNQRQEAKEAQQALVRAAKALTQQALNTSLPKAAEQAIAAGKPWQGTLKGATVALPREDWPTGKGYDLKFRVRPAGQTP
jgi:hypothetical protein